MIYLVEDDVLLAEHFTSVLKDHLVKTYTNAIDAIHAINNQLPELIILDIVLDGPSGFSLLNELQSYTDTAKIPVIICSGVSEDLNESDLSSYGVVAILDKTTMKPRDLYYEARKYDRPKN